MGLPLSPKGEDHHLLLSPMSGYMLIIKLSTVNMLFLISLYISQLNGTSIHVIIVSPKDKAENLKSCSRE